MCIYLHKYSGQGTLTAPLKPPERSLRRAVARPKKSPEDLRDDPLHVMLTTRERAELEQRADMFGVSVSEFVRRRSLGRPLPATAAGVWPLRASGNFSPELTSAVVLPAPGGPIITYQGRS